MRTSRLTWRAELECKITTTTRNNWNEGDVPGTTTQAVHVDGPSDPYTVATTVPSPYLDAVTCVHSLQLASPPLIKVTLEDSLHVSALPIACLPSSKGEKLMAGKEMELLTTEAKSQGMVVLTQIEIPSL
jgi:hypothetical protein